VRPFSSNTSWLRNKKVAAILALLASLSLVLSWYQGQLSWEQFKHHLLLFGSAFIVAHYLFKMLKNRFLAVLGFSAVCFHSQLREGVHDCSNGLFEALMLTATCFFLMRAVQSRCGYRFCLAGVFCGCFLVASQGNLFLLPATLGWLGWLFVRGHFTVRKFLRHSLTFSVSALVATLVARSIWAPIAQETVQQTFHFGSFILLVSTLGLFSFSLILDRYLTATLLFPAFVLLISGSTLDVGAFSGLACVPLAWLSIFIGVFCLARTVDFVTEGILVPESIGRRFKRTPFYFQFLRILRRLIQKIGRRISSVWLAELRYACRIEMEDYRIEAWLENNPNAIYADFYAYKQKVRLERGDAHPTLGTRLEGPKRFEELGTSNFRLFRKQGLSPRHKLVDYGCGSLRLGQHIIPYLNEGHYFGLDLIDFFFEIGRQELLDQGILNEKKPLLRVINEDSLLQAREFSPDFIISFAVLVHVPPDELDRYFANMFFLAHHGTTILIHGDLAERQFRYSLESWAHSRSRVERLVKRLGGQLDFVKSKPANFRTRPKDLADLAKEEAVKTVWMRVTFDGA
jgi:SAM-dependent methyltransferase